MNLRGDNYYYNLKNFLKKMNQNKNGILVTESIWKDIIEILLDKNSMKHFYMIHRYC